MISTIRREEMYPFSLLAVGEASVRRGLEVQRCNDWNDACCRKVNSIK